MLHFSHFCRNKHLKTIRKWFKELSLLHVWCWLNMPLFFLKLNNLPRGANMVPCSPRGRLLCLHNLLPRWACFSVFFYLVGFSFNSIRKKSCILQFNNNFSTFFQRQINSNWSGTIRTRRRSWPSSRAVCTAPWTTKIWSNTLKHLWSKFFFLVVI